MVPAEWKTRCLRKGEIHELVLTQQIAHGGPIDEVSYLGFAEITTGGVITLGDELTVQGRSIGNLHAFDETHYPNHYNLLIAAHQLVTGDELGLQVGDTLAFSGS